MSPFVSEEKVCIEYFIHTHTRTHIFTSARTHSHRHPHAHMHCEKKTFFIMTMSCQTAGVGCIFLEFLSFSINGSLTASSQQWYIMSGITHPGRRRKSWVVFLFFLFFFFSPFFLFSIFNLILQTHLTLPLCINVYCHYFFCSLLFYNSVTPFSFFPFFVLFSISFIYISWFNFFTELPSL